MQCHVAWSLLKISYYRLFFENIYTLFIRIYLFIHIGPWIIKNLPAALSVIVLIYVLTLGVMEPALLFSRPCNIHQQHVSVDTHQAHHTDSRSSDGTSDFDKTEELIIVYVGKKDSDVSWSVSRRHRCVLPLYIFCWHMYFQSYNFNIRSWSRGQSQASCFPLFPVFMLD